MAKHRREQKPTKEQVRDVIKEVEELDLPDGAHWALIHERLGLEYGDVFEYFSDDPAFFNVTPTPKGKDDRT